MGLSHPGTLKSEGGEVYSAALKLTKDRDEKGMCQVDFNNRHTKMWPLVTTAMWR